jgi:putative hemolysin
MIHIQMSKIVWEIFIVFILTLLNGFFACSEIALISVRKTRVLSLAKQGNRRARVIKQLQQNPESLFATIQIGISVITIAASAFAGSSIAGNFSQYLSTTKIFFVAQNSYAISFITVVGLVAYINLIIGELVPKSLGLRYAETFALFAAYPIWWLSKISYWLIRLLTASSNLILKPFKDSTNFMESRLSEEEIRTLLAEGQKAGTIEAHEHSIIENVFELSDQTVGRIMVPRTQITAFDIGSPVQNIIRQAIDSGYSRVPIFQGNLNKIEGILYTKKLLSKIHTDLSQTDIQMFLVPPYFVPNTMKISDVLQRLQRKKLHMALVTDEHGEIEGLVTLEDVLEEIVGDITDETDEAGKGIIKQEDGSFLVAGELSILDFNKHFKSELPETADFTTVSGFILYKLGRFPDVGDVVIFNDLEFTVKETTMRTVKMVAVKKAI